MSAPPPLATLADVKRVLRFTDEQAARDAALSAKLSAVLSWASKALAHVALEGPQTETYWDVYEDATLVLPPGLVSVTKVQAFEYPSSSGVPLSPVELGLGHGYEVTDGGRLILRPSLSVSPFEGATAQRRLRAYSRVVVDYEASDTIPAAVTEGIALLAAGNWRTDPQLLANLNSERIGDYAYSVSGGGADADTAPRYVRQAMWFLTPYLRRRGVSVT